MGVLPNCSLLSLLVRLLGMVCPISFFSINLSPVGVRERRNPMCTKLDVVVCVVMSTESGCSYYGKADDGYFRCDDYIVCLSI